MNEYAIGFAQSARKEIAALDASLVERIFGRVTALAREPRPRGGKKLSGAGSLYRLRIGDYRVIYEIDDRKRTIDVVAVRHRRDAYR